MFHSSGPKKFDFKLLGEQAKREKLERAIARREVALEDRRTKRAAAAAEALADEAAFSNTKSWADIADSESEDEISGGGNSDDEFKDVQQFMSSDASDEEVDEGRQDSVSDKPQVVVPKSQASSKSKQGKIVQMTKEEKNRKEKQELEDLEVLLASEGLRPREIVQSSQPTASKKKKPKKDERREETEAATAGGAEEAEMVLSPEEAQEQAKRKVNRKKKPSGGSGGTTTQSLPPTAVAEAKRKAEAAKKTAQKSAAATMKFKRF